jgi:hypothetical protein
MIPGNLTYFWLAKVRQLAKSRTTFTCKLARHWEVLLPFRLLRAAELNAGAHRPIQVPVDFPSLPNFPPHFIAGLGSFCATLRNPLIEFSGKPRASRPQLRHFGKYSQGKALGSPSANSEKR